MSTEAGRWTGSVLTVCNLRMSSARCLRSAAADRSLLWAQFYSTGWKPSASLSWICSGSYALNSTMMPEMQQILVLQSCFTPHFVSLFSSFHAGWITYSVSIYIQQESGPRDQMTPDGCRTKCSLFASTRLQPSALSPAAQLYIMESSFKETRSCVCIQCDFRSILDLVLLPEMMLNFWN